MAFYLVDHLAATVLCRSEVAIIINIKPEFIIAEIAANDRSKLLLAVVYRPPNSGYLNEFFQLVQELQVNYQHLTIFGDFNADMKQVTFDSQQMHTFITAASLYCVPYATTHHLKDSSTLLDLCIVDDDEKLMDYGQQGATFLSAHDLIYIKYAIKIQRRRGRRVVCRDWRDFDADSFQTDVTGIDWTSLISSNNMDEKIEIFNSELLRIFDSHVPLRQRNFKNLPAPWLRGDIQQAMRDRDLARRVWRRRRNDANYNRYKALRNSAHQAKQDYYNNIFNRARDANEIWNGLRHLGLIKSKDTGKCLTHAAGELNRFFVGYEAAQSMNKHDTLDDVLTGNFDEERFHWSYITPLRIRRAITRTKSNAVGLDGISLVLPKYTINSTMPIIEHLFNFSLMQGAFPKQWKVALIRPIPKIRNPTLCQHYRPISILPTLSKALERMVCEQIQDYLDDAGLCDPCQSAYRRNHSTQACIIRMLDDVRYAADLRKITVSVFFDFSKAFDRVDHLTLIRKLNNLNFSDSALRWIHSYLTGRTQAVKDDFNGTLSSPLPVVAGVPQGSVLEPLLFTMYLTDFGQVLRHCKYNFYADDLQIYIHCEPRDIHVAIRNINDDIEAIKNWTIANRLLLNPEKTQAIIMGTSRFINSIDLSTIPAVRVNGTSLQYSTSVKYLGVTILNTMSWETQVTKISNKVNSVLYRLKLCKQLLPEALKVRLVIALVFPHIDYCCAAYTDMTEEQNLKLYRAVNSCIRFIYGVRGDEHITPYYKKLRWLKTNLRRTYFVGCLLYSTLQTKQPSLLHANFSLRVPLSDRATRASRGNLYQPNCRTELFKRSFKITSISLWNSLPCMCNSTSSIRGAKTLVEFKSRLYKHLISCSE